MGFLDFLGAVVDGVAAGVAAVNSMSIESKKNNYLKNVTGDELSIIDLSAQSISNDIDNDRKDDTAQFFREIYVKFENKALTIDSNDSENYNEDFENALIKSLIIIEKAFRLSGKNLREND